MTAKKPTMRRTTTLGDRTPPLCAHCGKNFTSAGGYGGHYYFHLVEEIATGEKRKIHGDCLRPLDVTKWRLVPKPKGA